jgi:hypothetical protein
MALAAERARLEEAQEREQLAARRRLAGRVHGDLWQRAAAARMECDPFVMRFSDNQEEGSKLAGHTGRPRGDRPRAARGGDASNTQDDRL